MFVTLLTIGALAFALFAADASRHGGAELISHRPYENVRDGLPRSARSTTHLDL